MLFQGVRPRGGRTDSQLCSDVLPRLLVGALKQGNRLREGQGYSVSCPYVEFDYICTDSMRVHHCTLRSSYSQIIPKLFPNVKPATGGQSSTPCTYLKEAAAVLGEDVEPVEVEGVLADGWALADRGAALLHEAEQLVQPGAALRVVVNLIQALQILHFSLLEETTPVSASTTERIMPSSRNKISIFLSHSNLIVLFLGFALNIAMYVGQLGVKIPAPVK